MHMADALISPAVGGIMWTVSAGVLGYSIKKVQRDIDDKKIPLMGVMGAFVFAAQMINFSIPLTGSSGHIGGGILLSILLGPYAGFLTMTSVLIIQALFFADGGLLALGCNIFNLGFFTCFVGYPLIYKRIVKSGHTKRRVFVASLLAAIVGLQFGSLGVVLETFLSGKTELPLRTFLFMMQPIHLAIGIIEGLISGAIVSYIHQERPEMIENMYKGETIKGVPMKKVMIILIVSTLAIGGILSLFASQKPDGLEWAMLQTSGKEELLSPKGIHEVFLSIQEKTSILPDYDFKVTEKYTSNSGTSLSGVIGGGMTLILISTLGYMIHIYKRRKII